MFNFTGCDTLEIVWNTLKDEVYEMIASSLVFLQGIVVGAVLASVIWAIAIFCR